MERINRAKTGSRPPVKRKLITPIAETDNLSDDSEKDSTFKPSKNDLNSTDTETEELREEQKLTKKRKKSKKQAEGMKSIKHAQRNFPNIHRSDTTKQEQTKQKDKKVFKLSRSADLHQKLKSKLNHLKTQRQRTNSVNHLKQALEKAKEKSRKLHSIQSYIRKIHTDRLDQLLGSNELKRVPVTADGNCFFAAVVKSANLNKTPTKLRSEVCDYMIDNVERYIPFCSVAPGNDLFVCCLFVCLLFNDASTLMGH